MAHQRLRHDGERQRYRFADPAHIATALASDEAPLSSVQPYHDAGREPFRFQELDEQMYDPLFVPESELSYLRPVQLGVAHGVRVADAGAINFDYWATLAAPGNDVAMQDIQARSEVDFNSYRMSVSSYQLSRTSGLPEVEPQPDVAVSPHAQAIFGEAEMNRYIDTILAITAAHGEQSTTAPSCSELLASFPKLKQGFINLSDDSKSECEAALMKFMEWGPRGLLLLGATIDFLVSVRNARWAVGSHGKYIYLGDGATLNAEDLFPHIDRIWSIIPDCNRVNVLEHFRKVFKVVCDLHPKPPTKCSEENKLQEGNSSTKTSQNGKTRPPNSISADGSNTWHIVKFLLTYRWIVSTLQEVGELLDRMLSCCQQDDELKKRCLDLRAESLKYCTCGGSLGRQRLDHVIKDGTMDRTEAKYRDQVHIPMQQQSTPRISAGNTKLCKVWLLLQLGEHEDAKRKKRRDSGTLKNSWFQNIDDVANEKAGEVESLMNRTNSLYVELTFREKPKSPDPPTLGRPSSDSNPPVCENETASYVEPEPEPDLGGYAACYAPGHQSAGEMTNNMNEQKQSVHGPYGLNPQRFAAMVRPCINPLNQIPQLSRKSESALSRRPPLKQNIQKCPTRIMATNMGVSDIGKEGVRSLIGFFQKHVHKSLRKSAYGKFLKAEVITDSRKVLKELEPFWNALASPSIVGFYTYGFEIFSAVFETYWKPPLEALGQTTSRVSDDGNGDIRMLWDLIFVDMLRARITRLSLELHSALAQISDVGWEMQTTLNKLKNDLKPFGTCEDRWCWHPLDKAIEEIVAWLKYRGNCECGGERTRDLPHPHETLYWGIDMMSEDESVARSHSVALAHMYDCINSIGRDYEALCKSISVSSQQQMTRVWQQAPPSTPAGYFDMSGFLETSPEA